MRGMDIKRLIAPNFYSLHRDIQERKHSVYRLKGGRGSLKTSTIIVEVLLLMQRYPALCTAVFMKQSNRLRLGAFAAYTEMIERCNLSSIYHISYSPLQIRNIYTGQIIAFFGLDDPAKTKGISTGSPDTYFGITHFEELDQFNGNREIDTAIDSLTRGGDLSWCFQCYNPPPNVNNWVNKDSKLQVKGRLVHSSDYRTVPRSWLGNAFLEKVRACYLRDEREYRWRYLGEVIGVEGLIFKNIKEWQFDPSKQFDFVFNGLDLGCVDPNAYIRVGYCVSECAFYILDEIYDPDIKDPEIADYIVEHEYNDTPLIIESAGGGRVQYIYTAHGVPSSIVSKTRDLLLGGIRFIAGRKALYIDPSKTPNAYEEFSLYEWKKDKNGDVLSPECPVDKNNHLIDAMRYAISEHIEILGGFD